MTIRAGKGAFTAADPLRADLQEALATINKAAEMLRDFATAVRPPKVRTKFS
jgi:hypothetical protein